MPRGNLQHKCPEASEWKYPGRGRACPPTCPQAQGHVDFGWLCPSPALLLQVQLVLGREREILIYIFPPDSESGQLF